VLNNPPPPPTARVASFSYLFDFFCLHLLHCKKKFTRFLDLFWPNLPGTAIRWIIPGQGEFGKWHPGRGRESSAKPFYSVVVMSHIWLKSLDIFEEFQQCRLLNAVFFNYSLPAIKITVSVNFKTPKFYHAINFYLKNFEKSFHYNLQELIRSYFKFSKYFTKELRFRNSWAEKRDQMSKNIFSCCWHFFDMSVSQVSKDGWLVTTFNFPY